MLLSHLLPLFRRTHWVVFIQRLRLLGANSSALKSSTILTPEDLLQLTSNTHLGLSQECKTSPQPKFDAVLAFGSLASSAGLCHGASRSALWLPLDLVLEDALDGYQVNATSAIEIITSECRFSTVLCSLLFFFFLVKLLYNSSLKK